MQPRCWAEIDLEALRHNAAVCRTALPSKCGLMAIVKADGYGHGVEAVARVLADCVEGFGVANVTEAKELVRVLGDIHARRILILSPVLPEERIEAIHGGFSVPVSDREEVEAFVLAAKATGKVAQLHAVVDTGMGRLGAPADQFADLVEFIQQRRTETRGVIHLDGVASHFPSADEDEDFTKAQIERFRGLLETLTLGPEVRVHLANSAGLLRFGHEMEFATEP